MKKMSSTAVVIFYVNVHAIIFTLAFRLCRKLDKEEGSAPEKQGGDEKPMWKTPRAAFPCVSQGRRQREGPSPLPCLLTNTI